MSHCPPIQNGSLQLCDGIAVVALVDASAYTCRFVRMAYLALVASHTVNGVAALHTSILKDSIFRDFVDLWPHKFQNKTNGVTPRRWLAFCNPALADLITRTLGSDAWVNNLSLLTVSA